MARRADVFLHPHPGTDLMWLSAVSRYILDNGLAENGVSEPMGQRAGGVSEEPGAVHAGIRVAANRAAGGDAEKSRRSMIVRGRERLHSLGDGSDAAQRWARTLRRPSPICC